MKYKGVKITVQKYPPPLPLAWAFLSIGQGRAAQLHRAHFKAIWRSCTFLGACQMAGLLLLWPILMAPKIIAATQRNGEMVRKRTGKSKLRQACEQLWLTARYGFRPHYYYIFELFLPENRRNAGDYVHRYVVKDSLYRMLKQSIVSPLTDKLGFAAYCKERGLSVAGIVASLVDGKIEGGTFAGLPAKDLFIKRTRGRGGARAELWHYEDGVYRQQSAANAPGNGLDGDALMARLLDLSHREPFLVQERQVNHPDISDLSPSALATVRLLTFVDENGGIEPVRALFRMGRSADSIVDNFHAGGVAAPVDLGSGALGPATDFGLSPSIGWIDRHPATGAQITGRRLPQWDAVLALAKDAHRHFRDRAIVGWDIAITADGLSIVEGNGAPDVDNIQRPHKTPLGQSRFAELMMWHVNRFEQMAK